MRCARASSKLRMNLADLLQAHLGFGVGRVLAYGHDLVRPDDQLLVLHAVEGTDAHLVLTFAVEPTPGYPLALEHMKVEGATTLTSTPSSVLVEGATRIEFQGWTVEARGAGKLLMRFE